MYNVIKLNTTGQTEDCYLSTLVDGNSKFYSCSNIKIFDKDLSSLTNGYRMFGVCSSLKSFTSNLKNLVNGKEMFRNGPKFTTFDTCLDNLSNGDSMFHTYQSLSNYDWTISLPSLRNARSMFQLAHLKSFSVDLPSLENGNNMFHENPGMIFMGALPALRTGTNMFSFCYLSPESVSYIVDTIKDIKPESLIKNNEPALTSAEGSITISIDVTLGNDEKQNKLILDNFAKEASYESFNEINNILTAEKGWTVVWQDRNDADIVMPLSLDESVSRPIFVRLIEVEKEYADYSDYNEKHFYILDYGFNVIGPKKGEYIKFNNLAEAVESFQLIPYHYEERSIDE